MIDVLEVWKSLQVQFPKLDVDTRIKLFTSMNNENISLPKESKWARVEDFELRPTVVKILSFDRINGQSKFVDKFGFSNQLTFEVGGKEKVLDTSAYTFLKAFKESGCKSGDMAILCTVGVAYQDKKYRWWIIQKLGV